MITRHLFNILKDTTTKMPVISITGPRQSGKTTLIKNCFADFTYVNLESLENRIFARTDPKGFLNTYHGNLIIDEIQHVPDLFSYIQVEVDNSENKRKFILSGSQNFLLLEKITQSLAGRVAIFTLLPFSISELRNSQYHSVNFEDYLKNGFYPRIYDQNLDATKWLDDYMVTYIERDVRLLINIGDLFQFQRFIKLCAGRIGQLINFSELGNELGISYHTVQKWLSILEASYIVFRIQPWYASYNKRITKSSKLYFYDTGLASFLLGINSTIDINTHYARGALFENLVIAELLKNINNMGIRPGLYFWRDNSGNEMDCLLEYNSRLIPIEIKVGRTINTDWFKNFRYIHKLIAATSSENSYLVYGGDELQIRSDCKIISWENIDSVLF